jgi:pyrimidine precursor biosynthesis enzyme
VSSRSLPLAAPSVTDWSGIDSDPSDVTELIGSGKADLGTKAMIHTIAGKARGFPIKSIGTLMDEPFTGVLYLEVSIV